MSRIATTCLALIFSLLLVHGASADNGSPTTVKAQAKRGDDKVEIQGGRDKTVVLVRSPYGISQAVIERTGDKWPACLLLKLQLKGLEHLRLANGKTTLEAAVSVQDGKPSVRLWKDQAEDAPLDSDSPYWIKVRVLESDESPAKSLPLKDGLFELTLPKAFFEHNPKSITVQWIDFYRG